MEEEFTQENALDELYDRVADLRTIQRLFSRLRGPSWDAMNAWDNITQAAFDLYTTVSRMLQSGSWNPTDFETLAFNWDTSVIRPNMSYIEEINEFLQRIYHSESIALQYLLDVGHVCLSMYFQSYAWRNN